jgi:hypothetical protein
MIESRKGHNQRNVEITPSTLRLYACRLVLLLLIVSSGVITSCVLPANKNTQYTTGGQPILDTMIAQTVEARFTATTSHAQTITLYLPFVGSVGSRGENEETPPSPVQISTPTVFMDTATVTFTSTPQDTLTPTSAPCLLAKFVQDINVPAGTTFTGGTKFTKIWRVQNIGSCAWNSNFSLILVSGDALGAKNQVPIGAVVQPGANADLLVDFVAPKNDGKYRSGWMIYNTSGQVFGVGANGTDYLWVDIRVKNAGTTTAKSSTPTTKVTSKPSATTAPTRTSAPTFSATPSATTTATNTPTPTNPITTTGYIQMDFIHQ